MAHQRDWLEDPSPLKIAAKGRRTGITYAEALDDTLIAATSRSGGGDNVFYIGDTKDKGLEFIRYVGHFARVVSKEMAQVEEFLFEDKRGHCEYFASALALLGRAAGVPTRVVMGYRVSERSPFGYSVVRERNAHAWVEAWLPEQGWVTRDATPAEAQPQNEEREAGYFESSLDGLRVAYGDATDWLSERTILSLSISNSLRATLESSCTNSTPLDR